VIDDVLNGLNPKQKKAVQTTEGPLLILAGAGSGKTKTLTHRIAYLISNGLISSDDVLAVTFTNKAARELRERIAKLLGQNANNRYFMPFAGTFHSICVKILRKYGEETGISSSFVIFDEADKVNAVKRICKELMINEKNFSARTVASIISSAKNELVKPNQYADIAKGPMQEVVARVYPKYQALLKESNALDFDDLIGKTVDVLQKNSDIKKQLQSKFKYIMIDEYQDTNAAQYQLVKLLTNKQENIAVVGDDWQSVYSFRGADYRNILRFEKDFPKATVIKLEQNYRSTKNILDAAHKIITKNSDRSDKKLWTSADGGLPVKILQVANERTEGEAIIKCIQTTINSNLRQYKDFVVLYRTNAQSRSLEESFIRYGVPYKIVGGVRFYDRKEIKDIMAYLRLIYQPEDIVSFERVVNVPTRGIGAQSLRHFLDWKQSNNLTLLNALSRAGEASGVSSKAKNGFRELADIISSAREVIGGLPVYTIIDNLIKRIDYYNYLNDGTVQGESRQENVKEMLTVADEYQDLGLDGFLEEVSLLSDVDQLDQTANAVTLMTLHGAKGLEFKVVFMAGMEESLFPHSRALYDQQQMEEERRLCYVGMTRAQEELYLLYAVSRTLYGSQQHNAPSRFISEIDDSEVKKDSVLNSTGFDFDTNTSFFGEKLSNNNILNDELKYVPELNEGDGVKHQVFGIGTVLEIEGDVAIIYFKGKGTKKINTSFARIEKL
jgi:DNA helicase-2/ATP-dependent DNA helicase PcrA